MKIPLPNSSDPDEIYRWCRAVAGSINNGLSSVLGGYRSEVASQQQETLKSLDALTKKVETIKATVTTTVNTVADVSSNLDDDDVLTPSEKRWCITKVNDILNEQVSLDANATSAGLSPITPKTNYDSGVTLLTAFLNGLGKTADGNSYLWQDVTISTSLGVGGGKNLRTLFANVDSLSEALSQAIMSQRQTNAINSAAADAASKYLDILSYTNSSPGAFIATGKPKLTTESFAVGPQYQYRNTSGGTPMTVNTDGSYSRNATNPNPIDARYVADENHTYDASDPVQVYSARFRQAATYQYGIQFNMEGSAFPTSGAKGLLLWRSGGVIYLYAFSGILSYPANLTYTVALPASGEERLTAQWNNTLGSDGIRLRIWSNSTLIASLTDAAITSGLGAAYAGAKTVKTYTALLLSDTTVKVDQILHGQNTVLIQDGTIQARHIQAQAITGDLVAANTILTKNLVVANWDNLVPNPTTERTSGLGSGAEGTGVYNYGISTALSPNNYLRLLTADAGGGIFYNYFTEPIPCQPGDKFYFECKGARITGVSGTFYPTVQFLNVSLGWVSDQPALPVLTGTAPASPQLMSCVATVPAGCYYVRIMSYGSGMTPGHTVGLNHFYLRRMTDANLIVDGSVVTNKIAANAIDATKIQAKAIQTSHLLVTGASDTLNSDPNFSDPSAWGTTGAPIFATLSAGSPSGSTYIANTPGANLDVYGEYLPIEAARNYRAEAYIARSIAGVGDICYLGIGWYDENKTAITASVAAPAGWVNGSYSYFPTAVSITPPASWTKYSVSFGPAETCKIPSNAKYMACIALLNYGSVASAKHLLTGFRVYPKNAGDLIVDGTITAAKLETDLATANVIRSSNYSLGTSSAAPTGYKLAGAAFTTTYIGGATDSTCQFELGGAANIAGYKALTIANKIAPKLNVQSGTGTLDIDIPEGVVLVEVTLQAAGGNGGLGRGGTGGYYLRKWVAVKPHNKYRITIGAVGSNSTFTWVSFDGTSGFTSDSGFATVTANCGANGDGGSSTGLSGTSYSFISETPENGWLLAGCPGGDSSVSGGSISGNGGSMPAGYGGTGGSGTTHTTIQTGGGGGASVMGSGGGGAKMSGTLSTGGNGTLGAGGGAGLTPGSGGTGYGRVQWGI